MKHTITFLLSGAFLLTIALLGFHTTAQQQQQGPPQGPPPGGGQGGRQGGPPGGPGRQGGGRGGFGPNIDPLVVDDHTGFDAIFDGKTLKNWDGDPQFWRVENDTIIGESTPEKQVKVNTFLIYRGSMPGDFELKADLKMNSTNSGIQYRSIELPDVGKWVLKGYQADMDFANQFTGLLYEERGRAFLAPRGQMVHIGPGGKKRLIANLRNPDELKAAIKVNDWNTYHIIARGNRLTHIINGQLFSEAIDDDPAGRSMGGLLGFQMHVGPPMKLELRNIYLKNL
ncbi:MAG: DUF1080 domain-containing protein [Blastocatellia bacterium]